MKVHTIEIASAIEQELKKFLKDWGGEYPMRFTRFIDLGGRQTDLHVYAGEKGAPPWMMIRIKSVMKSEQGECIQVFVNMTESPKSMEEVMVSPEIWKLPALADKVLRFSKETMLKKISEGGALESGSAGALNSGSPSGEGEAAEESDDDDDYENIDTSGILAGDGNEGGLDFNPEDVIANANSEEEDRVDDPSELLRELNEAAEDEEDDEGEKS